MAERDQSDTGTITRTRTKTERKLRKPPRYKVLLHNDDYTTREFVLHVHQNGVGVAGVDTYEVAEVKVRTVESLARQREFPLMLSIEPEE